MRGIRGSKPDSDFQSGMVVGAITVIIAAAIIKAAEKLYQWATSRAVIPDLAAAVTQPMFSVTDLVGVVAFVLLLWMIAVTMTMFGRGA